MELCVFILKTWNFDIFLNLHLLERKEKKLWSLSLSLDFSSQTALPTKEQSTSCVTGFLETCSWSPLDRAPWAFAFAEFALTLYCNSSWLWEQLCTSLLSPAYKSTKLRFWRALTKTVHPTIYKSPSPWAHQWFWIWSPMQQTSR